MFKNSIFAFAVTASAQASYNVPFVCPEGKETNNSAFQVTGPSADKCCSTTVFSASCFEGATEGAGAIACPSGYALKPPFNMLPPFNAETCCEISKCTNVFVCEAETVLNQSAFYFQNASQSACCQTFVPDCFHVTAEAVITSRGQGYHLFECKEGTTPNTRQMTNTTVDQATCCEEFNATCNFHTGSLIAPVSYPCPAGKIANGAAARASQSPSEATCCMAYNVSCSAINDAQDVFPCAAGTVFNRTAAVLAPDQATCCMGPTCAAVVQVTCASRSKFVESKGLSKDDLCGILDMYDDAKDTFTVSAEDNVGGKCCKARLDPSTQFSRALEQHAGVGAGASAAIVLIMVGLHGL